LFDALNGAAAFGVDGGDDAQEVQLFRPKYAHKCITRIKYQLNKSKP
jgi:hypothetical protein